MSYTEPHRNRRVLGGTLYNRCSASHSLFAQSYLEGDYVEGLALDPSMDAAHDRAQHNVYGVIEMGEREGDNTRLSLRSRHLGPEDIPAVRRAVLPRLRAESVGNIAVLHPPPTMQTLWRSVVTITCRHNDNWWTRCSARDSDVASITMGGIRWKSSASKNLPPPTGGRSSATLAGPPRPPRPPPDGLHHPVRNSDVGRAQKSLDA